VASKHETGIAEDVSVSEGRRWMAYAETRRALVAAYGEERAEELLAWLVPNEHGVQEAVRSFVDRYLNEWLGDHLAELEEREAIQGVPSPKPAPAPPSSDDDWWESDPPF